MDFESIMDRGDTAEESSRLAEAEIAAAMRQMRVAESGDARRRVELALEQRARAREAVLAVVFEVEHGALARAARH